MTLRINKILQDVSTLLETPRNVITSLKNHYEMNYETSLKWMTNSKNYIYDIRNVKRGWL